MYLSSFNVVLVAHWLLDNLFQIGTSWVWSLTASYHIDPMIKTF